MRKGLWARCSAGSDVTLRSSGPLFSGAGRQVGARHPFKHDAATARVPLGAPTGDHGTRRRPATWWVGRSASILARRPGPKEAPSDSRFGRVGRAAMSPDRRPRFLFAAYMAGGNGTILQNLEDAIRGRSDVDSAWLRLEMDAESARLDRKPRLADPGLRGAAGPHHGRPPGHQPPEVRLPGGVPPRHGVLHRADTRQRPRPRRRRRGWKDRVPHPARRPRGARPPRPLAPKRSGAADPPGIERAPEGPGLDTAQRPSQPSTQPRIRSRPTSSMVRATDLRCVTPFRT